MKIDIGRAAAEAARRAAEAARKAQEAARKAKEAAEKVAKEAAEKAKKAAEDAKAKVTDKMKEVREKSSFDAPEMQRVGAVAKGARDKGVDLAKSAFEAAKEKAPVELNPKEAKDTPTAQERIDALGKGDELKLKVEDLEGDLAGLSLHGEGQVSVRRNDDDSLTLSAEGELGAGVIAAAGAKATGAAASEASASAYGTAGAKVELKFKDSEELAEGARTIGKLAAQGAAGSAVPGAGQVVGALVGPSAEELQALRQKVSAIEVGVGAKGGAEGELGVAGLALQAEGGAEADHRLRVEFEEGKPSRMALVSELRLEGDAGAGVGGAAGVTARLEQGVSIPGDLSAAELLSDPAGAVRGRAGELRVDPQVKLTLGADGAAFGTAAGLTGGGGGKLELTATGTADALRSSGALERLSGGDLQGAAERAAASLKVAGEVSGYSTTQAEFELGAHLGAVGGQAAIAAEHIDHRGSTAIDEAQLRALIEAGLQPPANPYAA